MKKVGSTKKSFFDYMDDLIEFIELRADETFVLKPYNNKIVFLLEGECTINNEGVDCYNLSSGYTVFLPLGSSPEIKGLSFVRMVIINLEPIIYFRKGYSIESLFAQSTAYTEKSIQIEIVGEVRDYIDTLLTYKEEGLLHPELQDIKIRELLYILSLYYDKTTLGKFFSPIVTSDLSFAVFIHRNWQKVKNIKELAALSFYSETSFNKKFKATFNITPYKWLNQKRASQIYHELVVGKKTIKQISDEYEFNTLQQFNSYCKSNFSYPPVQIRKQKHLEGKRPSTPPSKKK